MSGDAGTLQGKGQMVAILQAVETMLRAGYTPERTVYLSFGHDCLSGGKMGASRTAVYFEKGGRSNWKWSWMKVIGFPSDYFPGMTGSAAMIGVTERGHIRFDFKTQNTKRNDNKLDILSHALSRLSDQSPCRLHSKRSARSYRGLVGAIGYTQQVVFANTWLLSSVARRMIYKHPEAQMRSTHSSSRCI